MFKAHIDAKFLSGHGKFIVIFFGMASRSVQLYHHAQPTIGDVRPWKRIHNCRQDIVDEHTSVIIRVSGIILPLWCPCRSIFWVDFGKFSMPKGPYTNLSIPVSAIIQISGTSCGAKKHDFTNVILVPHMQIWIRFTFG